MQILKLIKHLHVGNNDLDSMADKIGVMAFYKHVSQRYDCVF